MRNVHWLKLVIGLSLILLWPSLSLAEDASSIEDIVNNLLVPTALVTKLVEIACYIIGLAFIFIALAQYKIHRQSPKLVPLATPIVLLILGIIAVLFPHFTKVGHTGKAKIEQRSGKEDLLPVPDTTRERGPSLSAPPIQNGGTGSSQDNNNNTNPPPSPPPSSGSGHWTEDPRYR